MVLPKLPGYRAGGGDLPVMAGGAEGNGGQQQVGDGRGEPAGQPGDVRAAEGPDERADVVLGVSSRRELPVALRKLEEAMSRLTGWAGSSRPSRLLTGVLACRLAGDDSRRTVAL